MSAADDSEAAPYLGRKNWNFCTWKCSEHSKECCQSQTLQSFGRGRDRQIVLALENMEPRNSSPPLARSPSLLSNRGWFSVLLRMPDEFESIANEHARDSLDVYAYPHPRPCQHTSTNYTDCSHTRARAHIHTAAHIQRAHNKKLMGIRENTHQTHSAVPEHACWTAHNVTHTCMHVYAHTCTHSH